MHHRSRLSVPTPSECLHSAVPCCLISVRRRRVCLAASSGTPLQNRVRSTLFSGRTASSWRFRSRKTGICGWSTPGSDAAKVVLLGEVLKLRWRGPTPPLRVTLW
jgi:hypothetical protein